MWVDICFRVKTKVTWKKESENDLKKKKSDEDVERFPSFNPSISKCVWHSNIYSEDIWSSNFYFNQGKFLHNNIQFYWSQWVNLICEVAFRQISAVQNASRDQKSSLLLLLLLLC